MKKSTISILAILALGIGFMASWALRPAPPIKFEAVYWFGDQARDIPDFKLVDHTNARFDHSRLSGKWHLMFFGYTQCPDICPVTLQVLSETLKAIEDPRLRNALKVVFVSVDPERDTPELLKTYVEYFDPDFIGASGPVAEIDRLSKALGIGYAIDKNDENQADYNVSHSGAIVLLNPEAKLTGVFMAPHDSAAMVRDLSQIIERY